MGVQSLRKVIDALDARLLALLARRVRAACALAEVKARAGLPQRDPGREKAVLARARKLARPPLDARAAEKIMAAIIRGTRESARVKKGRGHEAGNDKT